MSVFCCICSLVFVVTNALGMENFNQRFSGEITLGKEKFVTSRHYLREEEAGSLSASETKKYRPEFGNKFLKAVRENDIETVKKFLGVDVKTIDNVVSRSNNTEALRKNLGRYIYIKTRTDVNTQDEDGNTPLMWAVRNGNKEIVDLLLGCKDVDRNKKDKNGNDALDLAIMKGCVDIISSDRPEVSVLNKDVMILERISSQIAYASTGWIWKSVVVDDSNSTKINLLKKYIKEVCRITNIGEERRKRMVDSAKDLVNSWNPETNAWNLVCDWYNSVEQDQHNEKSGSRKVIDSFSILWD